LFGNCASFVELVWYIAAFTEVHFIGGLTLRHEEGDSIKGYLSVITTGRNANGNVVIDAGNKFQAELGLGQDQQATFLPDEVKTELGGGGSTAGVNFEFVSTSGWGQDSTPTFSSIWNSMIETKELKRAAESIDADTGIEDHTELSGEATREGAFLNFESESYKSNVILTKYFPDSQSIQGGVAFDTVTMTNEDSWSFLSLGGGQIKTSGGQDDQVIATGDDRVIVTGTQWYLRVRKIPAGPGPQGVSGEYEESVFDLATRWHGSWRRSNQCRSMDYVL